MSKITNFSPIVFTVMYMYRIIYELRMYVGIIKSGNAAASV